MTWKNRRYGSGTKAAPYSRVINFEDPYYGSEVLPDGRARCRCGALIEEGSPFERCQKCEVLVRVKRAMAWEEKSAKKKAARQRRLDAHAVLTPRPPKAPQEIPLSE